MKRLLFFRQTGFCLLVASCISLSGSPLAAQSKTATPREQIGEVLGKPVYRDQLNAETTDKLIHSLQYHFYGVLTEDYLEQHRERLEPTQLEFEEFAGNEFPESHQFKVSQMPVLETRLREIRKQLKSNHLSAEQRQKLDLDRQKVEETLDSGIGPFLYNMLLCWKMEMDIYRRYGGGRIRILKLGMEPLEATHRWLKAEEQAGRFKITDPKLKTLLYRYWTVNFQYGFLMQDPQEIRRDFLDPEWQRKARALAPVEARKP